jgi:hypothetical protein
MDNSLCLSSRSYPPPHPTLHPRVYCFISIDFCLLGYLEHNTYYFLCFLYIVTDDIDSGKKLLAWNHIIEVEPQRPATTETFRITCNVYFFV